MMYLDFFALHTKPFHTTPDPYFLYLSPSHKQALGSIVCGVLEKKGFIVVTGQVGLGKTTILRSFLAQVNREKQRTIYLLNPNLSFRNLLKTLLRELGHDPIDGDDAEVVEQLHLVLIEEYRNDKTVVLLIDEAQNMPMATLEHLRMLSNLETPKDKLIQIVLVGQPEFDGLLDCYALRQLRQRIAMQAVLTPLSSEESYHYIDYRLAKAGGTTHKCFSKLALRLLVREAKGIPRRLNILCDTALITALGYQQSIVTSRIAKEVIRDQTTRPFALPWKSFSLAAGVLCLLLTATWLTSWGLSEISGSSSLHETKKVAAEKNTQTSVIIKVQEDMEPQRRGLTQLEAAWELLNNSMSEVPATLQKQADSQGAVDAVHLEADEGSQLDTIQDVVGMATSVGSLQVSNVARPERTGKESSPLTDSHPEEIFQALGQRGGIAVSATYDTLNSGRARLDQDELTVPSEHATIGEVVRPKPERRANRSTDMIANLSEEPKSQKGHEGNFQAYSERKRSTSKKWARKNRDMGEPSLPANTIGDEPDLLGFEGKHAVSSKRIFAHSSVKTLQPKKKRMVKDNVFYDVAIIQAGDTLDALAKAVYGSSHPLYVQRVLDYNPQILDPKEMIPGQHVFLPRGMDRSHVQGLQVFRPYKSQSMMDD